MINDHDHDGRWERRRRDAAACALALAACLVVHCGGPAPPETASVPEVDTTDMQRPVAEAIEAAREAVLEQPDSPDAWGELGSVLYAHKLYDPAAVAFRRAHELVPRNFRAIYLLAITEDAKGSGAAEVIELFERAIAIEPRYPPLYQRYGDALVRQGRLEEARDAYRTVIELDSGLAISHRTLGQTLLQLGDVETSITHLERAAELRPEDKIVHSSLAQAYSRIGDRERAQEAAQRSTLYESVVSFPDAIGYEVESLAVDSLSLRERSNRKVSEGRHAEAIPDLELLVEMFPESSGSRALLGACYHRVGRSEEAIEQLHEAVRLQPARIDAHLLLAVLYYQEDRLDDAREHYAQALEIDAQHEGIFSRRALAMAFQGDLDGADREFARHAALTAPDAEVLHNWGTVLLRNGDPQRAVEQFRTALELKPDHPESLLNLGISLARIDRVDEALEVFDRLVRMDSGEGGRLTALANAAAEQAAALRDR